MINRIQSILAALIILLTSLLVNSCGEDVPWLAPLNPEFVKFFEQKAQLRTLAATDEGHAMGYIPPPIPQEVHVPRMRLTAAWTDPKYDMRDPNGDEDDSDSLLTSVRNQGTCGACWAFATYGALESHVKQTLGEVEDDSEDNLKHLAGFDWGPCDGGNFDMSTAYLSRLSGPISEADDPYDQSASSDYCTDCDPVRYVDNVVWLPTRSGAADNDYIKQALVQYGGLHTSYYHNDSYYTSSTKTYYYSGSSSTNHAVVIVGWDDNMEVPGAPDDGAFIVRNSWGSSWGESGYFYVSYYDTKFAFASLGYFDETPESAFSFDRVYYYDELGRTGALGYSDTVAWGANWFVPLQDERLTAVGFYAGDSPTDYEIYIYEEFSGSAFSDLKASKTGSVPHPGWYTIELDAAVDVLEGDGYGVVIRFSNDDDNYPIPLERPIGGYSSAASANPGESYISYSGSSWTDITSTGYSESNVCIKAFCSDPEEPANLYAAAFLGYGIYFWDTDSIWTKINNVSADLLASGDLNGDGVKDLVAVFNAYGTYTYIDGTWKRINSVPADLIATGDLDQDSDDDIAAVFSGYGTYTYIEGAWHRINSIPADQIATGDLGSDGYNDDMVASFSGHGTYTYIHAAWDRIKTEPASLLATGDLDGDGYSDDVTATFPTLGKYTYINGTWKRINSVPADLASTGNLDEDLDDDIAAVFDGYGTYTYVGGVWTRINKIPADLLASRRNGELPDEIAAAFNGYGTYTYANGSWRRINSVESSVICSMD